MQKTFRIHSQAAPEFHHVDIPRYITAVSQFDISQLMQQKNFLACRNGSIHCRITYCAKFKNFKIVRPDRISNSLWHDIKHQAAKIVQEYCTWYSTPPPRTTPAELQKTFLYDFKNLEEGETTDGWARAEVDMVKKWRAVNSIGNATRMLEAYFDEFPAMQSHPNVYALICGQMTPSMADLPLLMHFKDIFEPRSINMLLEAVLSTNYALHFCKELFRCNIYPHLTDVEGHLTFEIPCLSTRRSLVGEMIFHDLNIDLLVLGALMKESTFLQRRNPGADHMMHVLPNTIYSIFNMRDRMEYLCRAELWRNYHFTRVSCCGPKQLQHQDIPRRDVLSFAICDSCVVYCACENVNFNWTAEFATMPSVRAKRQREIVVDEDRSPPRSEKRARIPFTDAPLETSTKDEQKNDTLTQKTETFQREQSPLPYEEQIDEEYLNLI